MNIEFMAKALLHIIPAIESVSYWPIDDEKTIWGASVEVLMREGEYFDDIGQDKASKIALEIHRQYSSSNKERHLPPFLATEVVRAIREEEG